MSKSSEMVVEFVKDNLSKNAIVIAFHYSCSREESSWNLSWTNKPGEDGNWVFDNEDVFAMIRSSMDGYDVVDGLCTCTLVQELETGAELSQSFKLTWEVEEIPIDPEESATPIDDDGPFPVDADVILNKLKEMFRTGPMDMTEHECGHACCSSSCKKKKSGTQKKKVGPFDTKRNIFACSTPFGTTMIFKRPKNG